MQGIGGEMYSAKDVLLWVDRWTKYIWTAYRNASINMAMPIGYILNDAMVYYSLNDIIKKYKVSVIVIGYPQQHEEWQDRIDSFLEHVVASAPKLRIIKADEEYSSVQASATLGDFKKNPANDTLAAMHILEHFVIRYPL
jgi:RNase H-fold protein (predicted Holliday junction resolvase)